MRRRLAAVKDVQKKTDSSYQVLHYINVDYIDRWTFPSEDNLIWEMEAGSKVLSKILIPDINPNSTPDDPTKLDAFIDLIRRSSICNIPIPLKEKTKQLLTEKIVNSDTPKKISNYYSSMISKQIEDGIEPLEQRTNSVRSPIEAVIREKRMEEDKVERKKEALNLINDKLWTI